MDDNSPDLEIYDDDGLMTQEDWDRWGKLLIGTIRKELLNYLLVEIDYGQNVEKEQVREKVLRQRPQETKGE